MSGVEWYLKNERFIIILKINNGIFLCRRGHTVLKKALPPKIEYVFMIRMSPVQRKLYRRYIESLECTDLNLANSNPLKAFSVGCKVCVFKLKKKICIIK